MAKIPFYQVETELEFLSPAGTMCKALAYDGTPEGAVTANKGSFCFDVTNGDVYRKHTGAGNTGWQILIASGVPSPFPQWVAITKTFADFAAAALSNDIEIYSLPAGGAIHGVKGKHSAAFGGGAIATYDISVGIGTDFSKYLPAIDVFQAPGATVMGWSDTNAIGPETDGAATSIRAQAVATGANLDQAATGSIVISLLVSSTI